MEESLEQGRETTGATPLTIVRALNAARRWAITRSSVLLCALLLSLMSLNMLSVLWHKSITIDEIAMIPAAYYHLVAGNFQLVNDHPPLSKIIAAVPLLFLQPAEAQPRDIPAPQSSAAKWAYLERFWEDNRASFEAISFWTRVPMIALTVALGILIFVFARKLFGDRAAVLAVALYSLEPTVLAHGRVVQTDVPAAFGYLLVSFTLYRYLLVSAWRNALWLGVGVGVAILAKFSMLIVGPILTVTFVVLLWRAPRIGYGRKMLTAHAAVVTLAALLVIHAAYYFHSRALIEADALWISDSFPAHRTTVSIAVSALSYVLPTDMVLGVFWQVWHNGQGHAASLLGMYRATGWWYYFPVAFALKVPLPFLLLSLVSLTWSVYVFITKRDKRFLVVLIPFALYTIFVLFSRINIGVRYYLPAFPFLFILAGAFLDWLLRHRARRAGLAVAAVLLCWTAIEAARAYPNQMSYFNQLAASRPHWWYLSDSNVEWGDDVKVLAEYLRARGESRVSGAFLSGYLTPKLYGIEYLDLLAPADQIKSTRYAAVGASFLNGSTVPGYIGGNIRLSEERRINFFDAYRHREPEVVLGNSIYLYRVPE